MSHFHYNNLVYARTTSSKKFISVKKKKQRQKKWRGKENFWFPRRPFLSALSEHKGKLDMNAVSHDQSRVCVYVHTFLMVNSGNMACSNTSRLGRERPAKQPSRSNCRTVLTFSSNRATPAVWASHSLVLDPSWMIHANGPTAPYTLGERKWTWPNSHSLRARRAQLQPSRISDTATPATAELK